MRAAWWWHRVARLIAPPPPPPPPPAPPPMLLSVQFVAGVAFGVGLALVFVPAALVAASRYSGMHRWTLQFSDAALERRYTETTFRSTFVPFVACLCVLAVLDAFNWLLSQSYDGHVVFLVTDTLVVGFRVWLHGLDDQQRAVLIFGRCIVGWMVIIWIAVLALPPPTPAPIVAVPLTALIWAVGAAYLNYAGVHIVHRHAFVAISALGMAAAPGYSVLGRPLDPAFAFLGVLVGSLIGLIIERRLRRAFLMHHPPAPAVPALTEAALGPPDPAIAAEATAAADAAGAPSSEDISKGDSPGETLSSVTIDALTLRFSDTAFESNYVAQHFDGSTLAAVAFCASLAACLLLLSPIVPSAAPALVHASFFVLLLGGLRLAATRVADRERARSLMAWAWTAIAWLWAVSLGVAQRHYVLMSDVGVEVFVFAALWMICAALSRQTLVAMPLPRLLTYAAYVGVTATTTTPFSFLGTEQEVALMIIALLVGELLGFTLESHLRHRYLQVRVMKAESAHIEAARVLQARAHEARQRELNMGLRYTRALHHITDVVIELHADGYSVADMRDSVVTLASASFEPTFRRPPVETPGLLFELVDPVDAEALAEALAVAPAPSGRDPNDDQRRYRTVTLGFIAADGDRRRIRLQVTELTHSKTYWAHPEAAVCLLLVATDLTPIVRDVERDVERKAFRVVNHTSKRVMSNVAQSCEMVLKRLQPHAAALGEDGERAVQLLNSMCTQSVNGFHMCRSMLLQASVYRGEHQPGRDEFRVDELFECAAFSHSNAGIRPHRSHYSIDSPRVPVSRRQGPRPRARAAHRQQRGAVRCGGARRQAAAHVDPLQCHAERARAWGGGRRRARGGVRRGGRARALRRAQPAGHEPRGAARPRERGDVAVGRPAAP